MAQLIHRQFTCPPVLRHLGPRSYQLIQHPDTGIHGYWTAYGLYIEPHDGLLTDQTTLPWLAEIHIPRDCLWAAYLHDGLYEHASYRVFDAAYMLAVRRNAVTPADLQAREVVRTVPVTRDLADNILLDAAHAEQSLGHISGTQWHSVKHFVRQYGAHVWNAHDDGRILSD